MFFQLFFGFFIQVMPFAILAIYPYSGESGHLRFSGIKTMLLTIGLVSVLGCIFSASSCILYNNLPHNTTLFNAVNIVFLFCLLPCFFHFYYVVKITWQEKIFTFSFLLTSALAVTSVCNIISSWVYRNSESTGLPYRGVIPLIILASNLAILPLLLYLLKHSYIPVSDSLSKKENRYLAFLSFSLFLILGSGLIFMDYNNIYRNPSAISLYAAMLIMIFVIYFIFFRMLALSHDKLKAQLDSLNLKHQLAIQNEQYMRFNESIEAGRRMRHNLKHHMIILQNYISCGEMSKAEDYLNQRIHDAEAYEVTKISGVPVIDWIVSYYHAQAKENNVAFNIRISALPSEITTVQDSDFAVLLGNMLENAVTAASDEAVHDRYVNLNILCSGQMLAITLDNSFNGNVKTVNTKYLSTKTGHSGIGLHSIEMIAKKYNGGVEFTHEAGIFHTSVMLNISHT